MKLPMAAFMAALAVAGAAAAVPKDPCTLLKPADIQTLDPGATIAAGVLTNNAPLGASCAYNWGPRTSQWGQTALNITVVDTAKTWPGGFDVKQRILGEMRNGGPDASELPGIGDGAVFTSNAGNHNATVKAYFVKVKGILLEMTFHGGNALAQKDKLIALVRAAGAAL